MFKFQYLGIAFAMCNYDVAQDVGTTERNVKKLRF